MTIEMLKGKIHRATVVQAELDYVGSITVDEELLEAADASLNAVSTDFSAQSAARKYPQKVSPAAVVSTAFTLNIGWE